MHSNSSLGVYMYYCLLCAFVRRRWHRNPTRDARERRPKTTQIVTTKNIEETNTNELVPVRTHQMVCDVSHILYILHVGTFAFTGSPFYIEETSQIFIVVDVPDHFIAFGRWLMGSASYIYTSVSSQIFRFLFSIPGMHPPASSLIYLVHGCGVVRTGGIVVILDI